MANEDGVYNLTLPVVMAFPSLLTPRAFQRNGKAQGEPKYGANFVFKPDSPDLAGMKAKAAAVAKAKWPGRTLAELKFPFANGDKAAEKRVAKLQKEGKAADDKGDFMRGHVTIKASSKFQPRLSGFVNGKIVDFETKEQIEANKHLFYFGVEVLAQLNFVAYEGTDPMPDGVSAYLNLVLSTGKGKKLSGGTSAAEVFKGYVGKPTAEDPTDGLTDDEIPF